MHGGGVGAARFFARLGFRVVVTDKKSARELAHSRAKLRGLPIRYVLGGHRMSDIRNADLIVKNPGVPKNSPHISYAQKRGIPVTNDGGIFLELVPRERLIGVTGTKGKTTTTLLIAHMLGKQAYAVGTPGISFFDYFFHHPSPRWIVAEFSSFDLEYARSSPSFAVLTSLFADHLNRYRSFREYARTKMNLLRFQNAQDVTIAWSSREIKKYIPKTQSTKVLAGKANVRALRRFISWQVSPESVALAAEVARQLGISRSEIIKKLRSFQLPPGRFEVIAHKRGRTFINDTTATNPGAATHSLIMLAGEFNARRPITIIIGGEDKKFPSADIRSFARTIRKYDIHPVIIPGSFSEKLKKMLKSYETAEALPDAVERASASASIIALIPGAASFNMFKNEFHRGDMFKKAVRQWR